METSFFCDPRLNKLERLLMTYADFNMLHRFCAMGILAQLWHQSQSRGLTHASSDKIHAWTLDGMCELLEKSGFISRAQDGTFEINGNDTQLSAMDAWIETRRTAGKSRAANAVRSGGKFTKSSSNDYDGLLDDHQQEPARTSKNQQTTSKNQQASSGQPAGSQLNQHNTIQYNTIQDQDQDLCILKDPSSKKDLIRVPGRVSAPADAKPNPNVVAWDAYCSAFRKRYGMDPVRNAQTNGMIAQLVKRIGADDTPKLLTYYVLEANTSFYISKRHALRYALHDAETLAVDMQQGRSVTQTEARNLDRTVGNYQAAQRVIAKLERRNDETSD